MGWSFGSLRLLVVCARCESGAGHALAQAAFVEEIPLEPQRLLLLWLVLWHGQILVG